MLLCTFGNHGNLFQIPCIIYIILAFIFWELLMGAESTLWSQMTPQKPGLIGLTTSAPTEESQSRNDTSTCKIATKCRHFYCAYRNAKSVDMMSFLNTDKKKKTCVCRYEGKIDCQPEFAMCFSVAIQNRVSSSIV